MDVGDGKSGGSRQGSPARSDIFQIGIGIVLAVLLVQGDRWISAPGDGGASPHAIMSRHTFVAGIHMVGLECDRLVAMLNRVVRTDAAPCRAMTNFK